MILIQCLQNVKIPDANIHDLQNETLIKARLLSEVTKEKVQEILEAHYRSQCIIKNYNDINDLKYAMKS